MAQMLGVCALLGCLLVQGAYAAYVACPKTSTFNGCYSKRCIQVTKSSGQQATVCDECGNGYTLVSKGTAQAQCDCAPGFGVWIDGKYTDYICRPCPDGTQIDLGGTKLAARCLNCPATATLGTIGDTPDCVCPAGSYRAPKAYPGTDLKPVECRPCTALTAYTAVEGNVLSRCNVCITGKVANKNHTACVEPSDPDAAQPTSTDGVMSTETLSLDPLNAYSSSS